MSTIDLEEIAAEVAARSMQTLTLEIRPISVNGKTYERITYHEPLVGDIERAEQISRSTDRGAGFEILGVISDAPYAVVQKQSLRHLGDVTHWLQSLKEEAYERAGMDRRLANVGTLDELKEIIGNVTPPEDDRTFELNVPMEIGGEIAAEVSAFVPTIEAMQKSGKKKGHAQIASLVMASTGLTQNELRKMAARDFHVLEIWLTPFLAGMPTKRHTGM